MTPTLTGVILLALLLLALGFLAYSFRRQQTYLKDSGDRFFYAPPRSAGGETTPADPNALLYQNVTRLAVAAVLIAGGVFAFYLQRTERVVTSREFLIRSPRVACVATIAWPESGETNDTGVIELRLGRCGALVGDVQMVLASLDSTGKALHAAPASPLPSAAPLVLPDADGRSERYWRWPILVGEGQEAAYVFGTLDGTRFTSPVVAITGRAALTITSLSGNVTGIATALTTAIGLIIALVTFWRNGVWTLPAHKRTGFVQIRGLQAAELDLTGPALDSIVCVTSNEPALDRWNGLINEIAPICDVPPNLVKAHIRYESNGDPNAINPKDNGAGLGQITYGVVVETNADGSRSYLYQGKNILDPRYNLTVMCRDFIKPNIDAFPTNLDAIVCAYNAGLPTVRRAIRNGSPPLEKLTTDPKYIDHVSSAFKAYVALAHKERDELA